MTTEKLIDELEVIELEVKKDLPDIAKWHLSDLITRLREEELKSQ